MKRSDVGPPQTVNNLEHDSIRDSKIIGDVFLGVPSRVSLSDHQDEFFKRGYWSKLLIGHSHLLYRLGALASGLPTTGRRLLIYSITGFFLCTPMFGRQRLQGFCEQGGQTINLLSYTSSTATPVMRSYAPNCSVEVFNTGLGTLATIYSTSSGTSLSNPFTASVTGYWFFYADNGHYDVQMSGGGIPTPFTLGDMEALDLSVSLPIVSTSGTLSCPTCMTLDTAQTVTGIKTFNAPIFIGSNQITDTNAFSAWGGASLNDSTALGYVVSNIDHTWVNQDNEIRGVSSVVRSSRSTIDEQTYGWDQFGVAGVVVLGPMTMPSDPIYGSPYIRGQQKAVDSELYYQPSALPYTANIGMNYLADLSQLGSGVTLNTWAGLIVGQPGGFGGGGGHVVNGYGVWIQNLLDANAILTSASTAAIEIEGLGNYGRIWWTCNSVNRPCLASSIYSPVLGTLEFSADTQVQTATGVGFKAGGSAANAGMAAGSYAVGSVTLINADHSISTDAYINTSSKFEISGTTVIDSGRNGSFVSLLASGPLTIDVTGVTQCLHVNSLGVVSGTGSDCGSGGGGGGGNPFPGSVTANTSLTAVAGYYVGNTGIIQCDSTGCPTISIGNVYNVAVAGDIVTCTRTGGLCTSYPHHVDAGSYDLSGTPIITGSGASTLLSLQLTGASTTRVTAQCLHVDTSGNITGTGADCGSGGGGPSFTGTVTANSALTVGAGFFVGATGIIQYASGLPSPAGANIGNVYNIDAYGDIEINPTTAAHHVSSGTDATNGGYWLGTNQIIDGTGTITTNITGSVQCLHVNALGVISGTSADCGGGGGGGTPGGSSGQIQYNNAGVFGGFTAGGDLTFSQPNFTLNTVNSSPVSCGSSTQSCVLTINGKGLVTASSTATISGGSGGNPFTGSVTANTSLTNNAGFYINNIGVIQYSTSLTAVNIGNVLNINSNSGNIVTCQISGGACVGAGTGHVGSGSGDYGGYYIYNTQIIDGSANAYLGTVNGSSGIFTGSVTANNTPTNTAGFYIWMPATNPGGYTGNTGVIQYATGTPAVINIGHVQDITAGGTIFTTGHLAATPASNIVPMTLIGSTGGTADLMDVYTGGAALKALYVDYLGQTNIAGNLTVSGTCTGCVKSVSASGSGISVSPTSGVVYVSNTGVTYASAGTGIGLSGNTGSVTITNSGVTSASAGTGVGVSASTGAVTFSIGQAVATSSIPQFYALTLTGSEYNTLSVTGGGVLASTYQSNNTAYNAFYAPSGGFAGVSMQATDSGNHALYAPNGGVTAGTGTNGGFWIGSSRFVDQNGNIVAYTLAATAGVTSAGFAINGGYYGVTGTGVCTQYRGGICTSF